MKRMVFLYFLARRDWQKGYGFPDFFLQKIGVPLASPGVIGVTVLARAGII